jgi:hypothetical protein
MLATATNHRSTPETQTAEPPATPPSEFAERQIRLTATPFRSEIHIELTAHLATDDAKRTDERMLESRNGTIGPALRKAADAFLATPEAVEFIGHCQTRDQLAQMLDKAKADAAAERSKAEAALNGSNQIGAAQAKTAERAADDEAKSLTELLATESAWIEARLQSVRAHQFDAVNLELTRIQGEAKERLKSIARQAIEAMATEAGGHIELTALAYLANIADSNIAKPYLTIRSEFRVSAKL